jgi:hypothetical protein
VFAGASIISALILSSSESVTAYVEADATSALPAEADPLDAVHAVPTSTMPIAAAAIGRLIRWPI